MMIQRQRFNTINLVKKQKGAALMIVLFIFALVSILSVGMYNRQSLFIQMSSNLFAQSQAYELALANEAYAKWQLNYHWSQFKGPDPKTDTEDDEHMTNSYSRPFNESDRSDQLVAHQFNDVQGKLNINDLIDWNGAPNRLMVDRFKRLFNNLAITDVEVASLQDWLDENQNSTDNIGAEDGEYSVLEPPYRTASQPMVDVSELLMIQGMTLEYFELLKPHVTTLPQGIAPINVNTATDQVLMAVVGTISSSQSEQLIESRPWDTLADFSASSAISGIKFDSHYLDVKSSFFEVATETTVGDQKSRVVSLLYRNNDDGSMQTVSRDQSQKVLITKEVIKN